MSIVAAYDKTLFCNEASKYCVLRLKTADPMIPENARNKYRFSDHLIRFVAVGYNLPCTSSVKVELEGTWVDGKYGPQFQMNSFREVVPQTIEGILGYLSSGLLKGIGPKTAGAIVQRFGTDFLFHFFSPFSLFYHIFYHWGDLISGSLAASEKVSALSAEMEQSTTKADEIRKDYQRILKWSELFDSSDIVTKKMVAGYLIKRIKKRLFWWCPANGGAPKKFSTTVNPDPDPLPWPQGYWRNPTDDLCPPYSRW